MSRVAELWTALTGQQQLDVGAALRRVLGEQDGLRFVLAIDRDTRDTRDTREALADTAGSCGDCGSPGPLSDLWNYVTHELQMLCGTCKQARMHTHMHARGLARMEPGDVGQPFPTSMPMERP